MKTINTLLACAMCMAALLSCDSYDGVTIVNKSADPSQIVSFEYDGSTHTLAPGQSETYNVAWYTPAPAQIKNAGGGTVELELTGHYEFITAARIDLFVVNQHSRKVELEADSYIDQDGTGTDTTITLEPGENTSAFSPPVCIYTKRPNFRVKVSGTTQYINVPVKYHYSEGGTLESGTAIPPSMSVVIGP
ncbi:MAG: hypothetical protein LBQ55_06060 [Treponema sp.]|jgi:hypothetical protein|nr:hypothetical protein [Treponema sp.]